MNVSLFVTCLTDTFYPRTAMAVVKVLEALGCAVDFPQQQTCCGQPMWNNGFADQSRDLARRMVDVFADSEYVVTPSGSCAAMIRDYYQQAFDEVDAPAMAERAKALADKTYEFVEFLVHVLEMDPAKLGVHWEGKVTYHYSCHLRGIGVSDEATRLMRAIDGLELVPLEKADQCCGFGGTFATKYPQISGSLASDKVGCLQATGCPTAVSNDAGCTMNLAGACRRENADVRFTSLAEILAEGMGLLEKTPPHLHAST